ncbi:MAG: NAD(P)H-dependent oxidoreductase [Cytophagales bacterium]|nr:NAD(P)H-dependent oxidoreductase [Cytophagales bacterium]
MIRIISSTNRPGAVSYKVAKHYQVLLTDLGVESEIIDLANLPDDFIASALYQNSGKNEAFNPIREKMRDTEKYVFIVPEYNGSFPGILKTFIDGLEFPTTFTGKKAALVGLGAGVQGAVLAMSHLTDIFNYCGTNVLAQKPKLAGIGKAMNDAGEITNELYLNLLRDQAKAFVAF